MPNALAVFWMTDLDRGAGRAAEEADQPRDGTELRLAGSPTTDVPMSNIEVEWLPVETHVVID